MLAPCGSHTAAVSAGRAIKHAHTKTDRQTEAQGQFNKVPEPICKSDSTHWLDRCSSPQHSGIQMGQMHDDVMIDHNDTM